MILLWLVIIGPLFILAQADPVPILFIVGNTADQAPISGLEFEFYIQAEDKSPGQKLGTYISQTDDRGDGRIYLDLDQGKYQYRLLSKDFVLSENQTWQGLEIGEKDSTVFIWVSPKEDGLEIKDDPIPQGQTRTGLKPALHSNGTIDEVNAHRQADHSNYHLGILKGSDPSNHVWLALGLLVGLILGVIALDRIIGSRKS